MSVFRKLWQDDVGAITSLEMAFWISIVGIALITGLVPLRTAIIDELNDIATAISHLDQSYSAGASSFEDNAPTIFTAKHGLSSSAGSGG